MRLAAFNLYLALTLAAIVTLEARSLIEGEAAPSKLKARAQQDVDFEQMVLRDTTFRTQDIRRYIVSFEDTPSASAVSTVSEKISKLGGKIVKKFDIIPAITIDIPSQFVSIVEKMPGVQYVEMDNVVHAY